MVGMRIIPIAATALPKRDGDGPQHLCPDARFFGLFWVSGLTGNNRTIR
jgi:hypothetical protein